MPSPKQTAVPALDGLMLNEEPGAVPDSTMEFNLAPGRRREQVDRAKPLLADNPLVLMPREVTGARKPMVDLSEDATRKVSASSIAPMAPAPTPSDDGFGVAKFPPLVASPPRDGLLYNRWVTGAVLLAVLFVVGFVLTRGL
jgi:hypothetical protein